MYGLKKPIDWKEILKLTNNKPQLAEELLNILISELPALQNALNRAYKKNDWADLKEQVHKLHGSCCYTGVHQLKQLSQQLEETLRLNAFIHVEEILSLLNLEIERVLQCFNNRSYRYDCK